MSKKKITLLLFLLSFSIVFAQKDGKIDGVKKEQSMQRHFLTPLLYGVFVPGAGEFYNKKYVKGSIYLGIAVYTAYNFFYYMNEKNDAYDVYKERGTKEAYDIYRDKRKKRDFYLYAYFLNLAISSAHTIIDCYDIQKEKLPKSPMKALMFGVILPGGGDFYNKKYIKGAIFLGIGIYTAYNAYYYYKKQDDAYDIYEKTKSMNDYLNYKKRYDNMQTYFYYYAINLVISGLDGVVESYLSDWKVEQFNFKDDTENKIAFVIKKEF